MHETHLLRALFKKIERIAAEAGAARVTAVRVHIGALSHFSVDHFREHFEQDARGTIAEGATLFVTLGTDALAPDAQDVRLVSIDVDDGVDGAA